MDHAHPSLGLHSAWRIFPLGVILGVVALTPILIYLLADANAPSFADLVVYMVGTFSVVLAALVVLLTFLWVCEWWTEEAIRHDHEAEPELPDHA